MMTAAASMSSRSKNDYIRSLDVSNHSRTFKQNYIDSGILSIFLVATGIFEIIAVIWLLLELFLFLDRITEYSTLLENVTIILFGFLYYIWIVKALNGYEREPRQLLDLYISYMELAKLIDNLVHTKSTNLYKSRENKGEYIRNAREENDDDECDIDERIVQRTLQLCVGLIELSSRIFYNSNVTLSARVTKHVKDTMDEKPSIYEKIVVLMDETTKRVGDMVHSKCLHSASGTALIGKILTIGGVLKEIHIDKTVVTPQIFNVFINVALGFYFVIIIPFKIVTVAKWYVLLLYPILMHILTGAVIARMWIGEPFDTNRKLTVMNYRWWRESRVRDLHDIMRKRMERSGIISSNDANEYTKDLLPITIN